MEMAQVDEIIDVIQDAMNANVIQGLPSLNFNKYYCSTRRGMQRIGKT